MFCFTPKGKLIALPRHATPIDFAYAVHTDVGNMAVGAKINGKIAPLASELQNGDEVEIITSKAQKAPPAAWESIVVTGKARASIRRATRVAVRNQYAGLGRRIVERLFQRAKKDYSDEKLTGRAAAACARVDRRGDGRGRTRRDEGLRRRARHVSGLSRGARDAGGAEGATASWFGLGRAKAVKAKVRGRLGAASRCAASTATCRCGLRPMAARFRATASSAS